MFESDIENLLYYMKNIFINIYNNIDENIYNFGQFLSLMTPFLTCNHEY